MTVVGRVQPITPTGAAVHARGGFSLVELVIVVVIIGVIASIAVPRVSRGARQAKVNALRATVATVREAIDIYYAEHGRCPGYDPSTGKPDDDMFVRQLTEYTDDKGNVETSRVSPYIYGPYLRKPFPSNPFNDLATVSVKAGVDDDEPEAASTGRVAVLATGHFRLNAEEADMDANNLRVVADPLVTQGKPLSLGEGAFLELGNK
jgi:general secretion pathway protein G